MWRRTYRHPFTLRSSDEPRVLRVELREVEEELSYNEYELKRAEEATRVLKQEHEELLKQRDLLRAALAPILRIPNEILSVIFEAVLDDCPEVDDLETAWMRLVQRRKTIACVSRRWRDVALHTPRLWGYIWHFTGREFLASRGSLIQDGSNTTGVDQLDKHMARSAAAPLSVVVDGIERLSRLLEKLEAENAVDRIDQLHVMQSSFHPIDQNKLLAGFLRFPCPSVKTLSLNTNDVFTPKMIAAILEQYSSIRSLSILYPLFEFEDQIPASVPSQPVHLPHLHTLKLLLDDPASVSTLFQVMSTPNIVRLVLYLPPRGREELPVTLSPTVAAWTSVRTFTLAGVLAAGEVAELLHRTPNVEHLQLYVADDCDLSGILQRLQAPAVSRSEHDHRPLVPADFCAPYLRIVSFKTRRIPLDALHDFIDFRRLAPQVLPLQAIGLLQKQRSALSAIELQQLTDKLRIFAFPKPVLHDIF